MSNNFFKKPPFIIFLLNFLYVVLVFIRLLTGSSLSLVPPFPGLMSCNSCSGYCLNSPLANAEVVQIALSIYLFHIFALFLLFNQIRNEIKRRGILIYISISILLWNVFIYVVGI